MKRTRMRRMKRDSVHLCCWLLSHSRLCTFPRVSISFSLKLPKYSSKSVLAEKLRVAIQNNTGFHLT